MDFVKTVEEIYRLEYIISQLEKGQEKRAKTRGRGFKADMWLQDAKPRLESLLDQVIKTFKPYVDSHWMNNKNPWRKMSYDDMLKKAYKKYSNLRKRQILNKEKLTPWDAKTFMYGIESNYRLYHKVPKAIKWIKKQKPTNLKEKLVLFHVILNIIHERGKLSFDIVTSIEFDKGGVEFNDITNNHKLVNFLDKLSAGPKPEWDSFIEKMLLSESTLQKYISMILN